MIWESANWKEPLLHSATWLRRKRLTSGTREATYVRIEKEIFLGFYSVRKLLDTYKVSDTIKAMEFSVKSHPNLKPVNYMNWHHIDRLYDLSQSAEENRDIRYLCNRFMHSYVFLINEENERLAGFYVASDHDKNKKIYYISLDTVINIFRLVGRDYPAFGYRYFDKETGDLVIKSW